VIATAPERRPLELTIVPDGPWAHRLERALDALRDAPLIALGPTSALVVAAHPSALDPDRVLAGLPGGAIVVTHARAVDSDALARSLTPDQRERLAAVDARVYWVDALDGDGPRDEACFVERLAATSVEVLRGDTRNGCARLDPAALEPRRHAAEVDFRAEAPPRLPAPPEATDPAWRRALWTYHRRGDGALSEAAPAPGVAVASVALRELARHVRAPRPWPLRLHLGSGGLIATPLAEALTPDDPESELAGQAHALAHLIAERAGDGASSPVTRKTVTLACDALIAAERLEPGRAVALRTQLARVTASWPDDARLVPLGPHAPLVLHLAAVRAAREAARDRFDDALRELDERLADALLIDALHAGRTHGVGPVAASLGTVGGQLVDAEALGARLPDRASGVPLSDERRARLEAGREAIRRWLEPTTPTAIWAVTAPDHALAGIDLGACRVVVHPLPLTAAASTFDRHAEQACTTLATIRAARLELAGTYRAELHAPMLEHLGWRDLSPDELAALPGVVAITRGERLRNGELGALLTLLRSGRPLQALILTPTIASERDLDEIPLDLGYLAACHHEANVVQAALTSPADLVHTIESMATAPRPGVAAVGSPDDAPFGYRWLRTVTPLYGRALLALRHDADAGDSWADRVDVRENPAPDAAWPRYTVVVRHDDGSDDALEVALTYADAVSLEPALRHHLRAVPREAWCDEMVPLEEWVAAPADARARSLPYVWTWDHAGGLARAVVTRALARATADRARGWRAVQELGGFDNAWASRAVEAERGASEARLSEAREQDRAAHEAALESVRTTTAREAMARLASVLLELEPEGGVPRVTVAPRSIATPEPGVEADEAESSAPPEEDDDEPLLDAPYITAVLCTSCNDCMQLDSTVFSYDADKRAVLNDPSTAPFAVLVKAAEACPSGCIHPGRPRDDDPTVTPELVARAQALGR